MLLLIVSCHRESPHLQTSEMFAGTASPIPSQSLIDACAIGMRLHKEENLRVVSCWTGTLNGKLFVLSQLAGTESARVTIVDAGSVTADRKMASNSPVLFRFIGSNVCFAEKAGARHEALNIETGAGLSDEQAQNECAPASWPPDHVLGLPNRYPILWPGTNP